MLKLKRQDLSVYQDGEFEFRPHEDGMYVYWDDLLPVLREGRLLAKMVTTDMAFTQGCTCTNCKMYPHAEAFLTATAAIEEEKGVEG